MDQLVPLDPARAARLHNALQPLHRDFHLVSGTVEQIERIELNAPNVVSDWLRARPLQPGNVLLAWDADTALQAPWGLFVSRWNDFWYPDSDDLVVVDEALSFVLLFAHDGYAFFGVVARAT